MSANVYRGEVIKDDNNKEYKKFKNEVKMDKYRRFMRFGTCAIFSKMTKNDKIKNKKNEC